MYLKRKADAYLNAWKSDPNRSPLIIKGPRQVGKTETIDYFAAHNYRSVVEINFVEEPKYRAITADGYGADTIVRNISLIDPAKKFIPGDTLIFFDEIQAHPDIVTALKFFKIDGKYDVICSGSMLGISYKQIESNSVGYKTDYEMRSLDFEEFLWARGYDEAVIESMFTHLCDATPFSEVEMNVFSTAFMDYCVLGGMPAVVASHIRTGTFEEHCNCSASLFWTTRRISANTRKDSIRHEFSTCSTIFPCNSPRKTRSSKSARLPAERVSKTIEDAWNGLKPREW